MGIDYGDRRVGVALSDPERRLATPLCTLAHRGWGPTAIAVIGLMREHGAEYAVVGLPRDMDGSLGAQAEETLGFCGALEKRGVKVLTQDERLSSVEAEEMLLDGGAGAEARRRKVDQAAAAVILQRHLDALRVQSSGQ
mgnify:CR=1 FL=1